MSRRDTLVLDSRNFLQRAVSQSNLKYAPRGLQLDGNRHFRFTDAPVFKINRIFENGESQLFREVRHLDLKDITVRTHRVEPNAFKRAATPTLESRRRIANLSSQDHAHPNAVRPLAQEKSPAAPARIEFAAGHIARTDDDIKLVYARNKRRQIIRRVRKISVHLDDAICAMFERPLKAGNVSGAQAQLPRSMHDRNLVRAFGMKLIRNLSGAILGMVVDDQKVSLRERKREELSNHRSQILRFIVSWKNYKDFHKRADYNIVNRKGQFFNADYFLEIG